MSETTKTVALRKKYSADAHTLVLWNGNPAEVGYYQNDEIVLFDPDDPDKEVGRFKDMDAHPKIITLQEASEIRRRQQEIVDKYLKR